MYKIKNIIKFVLLVYIINIFFIASFFIFFKLFNFNFSNIKELIRHSENSKIEKFNSQKNIFWANKIIDGGYILYFRHSERNKLPNLKAFDGLEILNKIKAEDSFFANRSCLNQNGKVEAKLIGEYFKKYDINYSKVISSPSCRARETAMLAFNKIDEINNLFMYLSPFVQSVEKEKNYNQNIKIKKMKNYFATLKNPKEQNIIIVGHKGILLPSLIKNNLSKSDLQTLESGFVVLEVINGDIFFKYKFNSFEEFTISLNKFMLD